MMIDQGRILQQRYRIERQIGQGGMGAVYIATDERFGAKVAIKQTLCMDENYQKAAEREAKLLNSLKHSALPRVSDHFFEDDGQFLVMEYIPGEDLGFLLERDGRPFEFEKVKMWSSQILDALDFLHSQSNPVIHRDIKPQNLKLTDKGQIVLLDFGLAKGSPAEAGNQTAAKSVFGYSRNYASLEQIQGTGTDPRSDLYALAATLYHLVTGEPPADALTRATSVLSKKPDPLVPAHLIRDEVPKGFAAVLHNALDLDAGQRPQTASAMKEMLSEYEAYEHLIGDDAAAADGARQAFHAQATQLLPGATVRDRQRFDGRETALMSDGNSEVTHIAGTRSVSGIENVRSGGATKVAVAGGGILLAGIVSFAAFYFQGDATVESMVPPVEAVAETVPAAVPVTSPEPATDAAVAETEPVRQDHTNNPASSRAKETAKKTVAKQTATADANSNVENGSVVIDQNGRRVVVHSQRIEMPDMVIEENGFREKKNGRLGPLLDFRHMSIDQMQKLRTMKLRRPTETPRTPPTPMPEQ